MHVLEKEWLAVDSSCLKAVRFHSQYGFLDVYLKTGRMYRYSSVTHIEYHELITGGKTGSVGKEFNNIKLRREADVVELDARIELQFYKVRDTCPGDLRTETGR